MHLGDKLYFFIACLALQQSHVLFSWEPMYGYFGEIKKLETWDQKDGLELRGVEAHPLEEEGEEEGFPFFTGSPNIPPLINLGTQPQSTWRREGAHFHYRYGYFISCCCCFSPPLFWQRCHPHWLCLFLWYGLPHGLQLERDNGKCSGKFSPPIAGRNRSKVISTWVREDERNRGRWVRDSIRWVLMNWIMFFPLFSSSIF